MDFTRWLYGPQSGLALLWKSAKRVDLISSSTDYQHAILILELRLILLVLGDLLSFILSRIGLVSIFLSNY